MFLCYMLWKITQVYYSVIFIYTSINSILISKLIYDAQFYQFQVVEQFSLGNSQWEFPTSTKSI